MAPTRAFVAAVFVIALLAAAGSALAEARGQTHVADPPDHAKAKGLAKRAEPVVEPPASTTPPASAETPPPEQTAPAPAPPAVVAAPSASYSYASSNSHDSSTSPTGTLASAASGGATQVPRTPTAPSSESLLETRSAGGTTMFAAGATTTRTPSWSNGPLAAPTAGADDAPWWVPLAWALPFVGIGGVAAVLVARHRKPRAELATVSRTARMRPVSPDDVRGLLQNGQVAAARGALDEAVAWFERALAVSPKLAVAYFCKGVCLAANGQVADAYGALRSAIAEEPGEATYRVHFARVAVALGKHKEAMDALELVTRAMPELGPAMLDDPQLAGLRDHPRFLMICGAL